MTTPLPNPGTRRPPTPDAAPPTWVREAVRDILDRSAAYRDLDSERRRSLARAMVQVSALAAHLIGEELTAESGLSGSGSGTTGAPRPLARAQAAPGFGAAADRVASTTRSVLNAVSFPRFVTDLINGVFRAMLDSTSQQMTMYVELLNNVSASLDGFANTQFSQDAVRRSLVERFPDRFELEEPEVDPQDPPPAPEDQEPLRLRLRPNASMPKAEEVRAALGIEPAVAVDASNPEQLVPLARRQMARQRQQMLATMVMLGMQRIVVESGRIHASMRFHVDTRSATDSVQGSSFNMQNRVRAGGSFGFGPWGASADIENTVGYVSTQRSQSNEELNTDLELNSSVEINFRSDYLPLNRMAAQANADRIRANTLNPDVEMARTASEERRQRETGQRAADQEQMRSLDGSLDRQSPGLTGTDTPLPTPGGTGTSPGTAPATPASPVTAPVTAANPVATPAAPGSAAPHP
ncbi:hypothetical protein [uncultured Thiodictyon sp.]|uniref:hypothetical protein n=1 Tax=uncultured Thiodictyon sp. TaxID=1846217 RepID=UPI0025FADDE8|nr:hypothetical protein [uncultured Thiodictyon sp.]